MASSHSRYGPPITPVTIPTTAMEMNCARIQSLSVQITRSAPCRASGRELVVSNSGALPAGQLEKIPPRFTSHPGGHGMGLYLVRRICERYGWAIRLENAGGGVTATLAFESAAVSG